MKVAIYGVGAIGGLIGARLAMSGCDVTAVARGATLAALQTHGLLLDDGAQVNAAVPTAPTTIPIHAVDDARELGTQDLVVIAVKATQIEAVAAGIGPLIGPDTPVMTAMNGVPWWFFDNPAVPLAGLRLPSLDPGDVLRRAIPLARTLGCVVHLAASCPEPGLVRRTFGNRLLIGGATAGLTSARDAIVAQLSAAGFDAVASDDIRTDIWYKLWGNMTFNPVSVLTGATADRILDDPQVRNFCLAAMAEAAAVGARIGCSISQSGQERLEVARQLGAFKTSMLQDAESGRALEIDALVTVVHEIGMAVGVPTPMIDALLGLIRLNGRVHGLHPWTPN
jgi:2-dehydropantoate 2-reductase